MNNIDLTTYNFKNDRTELRKEIINIFLNELPGTGKGEFTSKYKYLVFKKNKFEVFLSRPAQFNNGFDFTLNVANINFNPDGRATTRPTHKNICDDLFNKKNENKILFKQLEHQIDLIFNCQNPVNIDFDFFSGIDTAILLECIKWLFVEQDVTYWNYSGRSMFYNSIKRILDDEKN